MTGSGFATYADAYLWAENFYRVGRAVSSINECVNVCDDLFYGDGYGTLACPTSQLELELLQDIFWQPDQLSWTGIYRTDSCPGVDLSTSSSSTLSACTNWYQCSSGATAYNNWKSEPDNAGEDCAINEKCVMLEKADAYGAGGRRSAASLRHFRTLLRRALGQI